MPASARSSWLRCSPRPLCSGVAMLASICLRVQETDIVARTRHFSTLHNPDVHPVRRPGSHTLRHTCVQRLIDAQFPLKTIGDYVGHRCASATEIYIKVDVESLREVAIGDGEALL